MHSFLRKSNLLFVGLCALAVVATTPSAATAAEEAEARRRCAARIPAVRPVARSHHRQPHLLRSRDHRRGLRRLDQLVDHRRRILAQGHRGPVRLQLRPADRRHHRRRRQPRVGRRHHRGLLLRSEGDHPARRAGRADLQHHQPGRRRLHQRHHRDLQRRLQGRQGAVGRCQPGPVLPAAQGPERGFSG